jgi:anti-anti-sigma factor
MAGHSSCSGPSTPLVVVETGLSRAETTVVISGELDLITRPLLAERLSVILRRRPRRLILDLSGTCFMDCGSARMIASAAWFLPDGARLIIRSPSPAVRRVLMVTGFGVDFEIEDEHLSP